MREITLDDLKSAINRTRFEQTESVEEMNLKVKGHMLQFINAVMDAKACRAYIGAVRIEGGVSVMQCGEPLALADSLFTITKEIVKTMPLPSRVLFAWRILLGRVKAEIQIGHRFIEDLNVDSLDTVELAIELEVEFECHLDDEVIGNLKTVQEVIDHMRSLHATESEGGAA